MNEANAYHLIDSNAHEFQIESHAHDGLSFFMGSCVAINLLMGSGFLTLPYVFHANGIYLSMIILITICVIMCITCYWEGIAVCNARKYLKVYKVPEVTETLRFYCGQYLSFSYLLILSLSLWGSVWVYAILFGQSMSSELGFIYQPRVLCENGDISTSSCYIRYNIYLLLLCAITTPIALLELKEQAWFQYSMTVLRIILIIVMCYTVFYAYSNDSMEYCFPYTYMKEKHMLATAHLADYQSWRAIFGCISSCVFALYLNSSIPVVAQGLQKKTDLNSVILIALMTTVILYGSLGAVVSICFEEYVDNPTNLNWTGFRWPEKTETSVPLEVSNLSAKSIELLILLFPAIDVLSVYPLTTRILSNNIIETIWGIDPTDVRTTPLQDKYILRCCMNIFPIVLASIVPKFVYIVDYVGGISVSICLVFPALLCICGRSYSDTRNKLIHLHQYDNSSCDMSSDTDNTNTGVIAVGSKGAVASVGIPSIPSSYQHNELYENKNTNITTDVYKAIYNNNNTNNNDVEDESNQSIPLLDHMCVAYTVLCIGCILSVLIIVDGVS